MSVSSVPGAPSYGFKQTGSTGDTEAATSEDAGGSTASKAGKSVDDASDGHSALTDAATRLSSDVMAVLVRMQTYAEGDGSPAREAPSAARTPPPSAGGGGTAGDETSAKSSLLGAEFQQLEKALAAYFARTSSGAPGDDTSA